MAYPSGYATYHNSVICNVSGITHKKICPLHFSNSKLSVYKRLYGNNMALKSV